VLDDDLVGDVLGEAVDVGEDEVGVEVDAEGDPGAAGESPPQAVASRSSPTAVAARTRRTPDITLPLEGIKGRRSINGLRPHERAREVPDSPHPAVECPGTLTVNGRIVMRAVARPRARRRSAIARRVTT
jgi:hypothetical protein